MKNQYLAITFSALATACSPQEARLFSNSGQSVVGPDGHSQELVSCYEIESCYQKARNACSGNYSIVHSSSSYSDYGDPVNNLLVSCSYSHSLSSCHWNLKSSCL